MADFKGNQSDTLKPLKTAPALTPEASASNARLAAASAKTSDHSLLKRDVTDALKTGGAQAQAEVRDLTQQMDQLQPGSGTKLAQEVGLKPQEKTLLETIGSNISTETKTDIMEFGGKLTGKEQAATALDHYKNGKGADLRMPTDFLREQQEITDAEGINQDAIGQKLLNEKPYRDQLLSIQDGESAKLLIDTEFKGIKAKGSSDLHYTSNLSNLDTDMDLTFTRKGDTLTFEGTRTNNWHDLYDWQKGTKFMKGMITGDEMQALPDSKPFKMFGKWEGSVSGHILIEKNGKLGVPKFD